jgi:hypothetical protein
MNEMNMSLFGLSAVAVTILIAAMAADISRRSVFDVFDFCRD